jgi:hypothetical protein
LKWFEELLEVVEVVVELDHAVVFDVVVDEVVLHVVDDEVVLHAAVLPATQTTWPICRLRQVSSLRPGFRA